METGPKIRMIRKRLNLTRRELAHKVGITPYYVLKLEEGISKPGLDVVAKLAAALHTTVEFFTRSVLEDMDILRLEGRALRGLGPEDLVLRRGEGDTVDWGLNAPFAAKTRSIVPDRMIRTDGWSVEFTAENVVYVARSVLKAVGDTEFNTITALTERAGVIAASIVTLLYEGKDSACVTLVMPVQSPGGPPLVERDFHKGMGVLLLDEVARRAEPFLAAAERVRRGGARVSCAVSVLDLLNHEERVKIEAAMSKNCYRSLYSAEDVLSVAGRKEADAR